MSGLARISYPDGELMLPAGTAYELDVLWDHVQWYTRRHGGLRVELEPNEWFVTKRTGNNPNACSRCHNRLSDIVFVNGSHMPLCQRCARQQVAAWAGGWTRSLGTHLGPMIKRWASGLRTRLPA